MYTPAILAIMFSYQPPNEDTSPKYKAVGEAKDAFDVALTNVFADLEAMPLDPIGLHERVSAAALNYATAIVNAEGATNVMGDSGAVALVTDARMWANKAVRAPAGVIRGRLISLARTASEHAQLRANACIALAKPIGDAYDAMMPAPTTQVG